MMFKDSLEEIMNRTDGCVGALIMGTDGIAVERVWKPEGLEANLDVAIAEYTVLVRAAQHTNSDMGLGKVREVVIIGDGANFLMRLVSDDYFLALILKPESNIGRGRYELRRAELSLEKEFAFE
jgi:predicted regulator of Ras-like GTPase activity (Roadblock/LC7/MglB family)